ncbi:MAG: hypothetical protein RL642_632 [Bacteroidota bacterium]|jgi:hypothetical protein
MKNLIKKSSLPFLLLAMIMIAWMFCVITLAVQWKYSIANDSYQYTAPFAFHSDVFHFPLPMMDGFMPFSGSWGVQWPLLMQIKSVFYAFVPFSLWAEYTLIFSFALILSILLYKYHTCNGGNKWIGVMIALAMLFDRAMLHKMQLGRSEVIVALLFLWIVIKADQNTISKKVILQKALPYILLPTLHPLGFMVAFGLSIIQLIFAPVVFQNSSTNERRVSRLLPITSFLIGLVLLAMYFTLQPDALEQLMINMKVQSEIYNTASRFTYFQYYLAEYPFGLGYLIHGLGFLIAFQCIFKVAKIVLFQKEPSPIKASTILSSSIVIAMPIIGFIFRTDNYFHFVIAAPVSLFLVSQYLISRKVWRFIWIYQSAVIVLLLFFVLSNALVPTLRFYNFLKAGMPNYHLERCAILESYKSARRIYVPPNMWAEAGEVIPEKAVSYKFPMPMLKEIRQQYEEYIYDDVQKGDILIVELNAIRAEDRFGENPIRTFTPPNQNEWKFLQRYQKMIPGRVVTGWNLMVYEKL